MSISIPANFTKAVVGRTITAVAKVGEPGDYWLGLQLDDGKLLVIQRDPEGNGGGFVEVDDKNGRNIARAGCV